MTTIYQLRCPHCDQLITVETELEPEQAPRPARQRPRPRRQKFGQMRAEDFPPGYFPPVPE